MIPYVVISLEVGVDDDGNVLQVCPFTPVVHKPPHVAPKCGVQIEAGVVILIVLILPARIEAQGEGVAGVGESLCDSPVGLLCLGEYLPRVLAHKGTGREVFEGAQPPPLVTVVMHLETRVYKGIQG